MREKFKCVYKENSLVNGNDKSASSPSTTFNYQLMASLKRDEMSRKIAARTNILNVENDSVVL